MGIKEILGLITGATQVVRTFDGSAKTAQTVTYVQEAISTIVALTPLVQQWGNGEEVTLEDARRALAGKDDALKRLDDIIASK